MGKQSRRGPEKWRAFQKRQSQDRQDRKEDAGAAEEGPANPTEEKGMKGKDGRGSKKERAGRSRTPEQGGETRSPSCPRRGRPCFSEAYPFGVVQPSRSKESETPGARRSRTRSPADEARDKAASSRTAYDDEVRRDQDERVERLSSYRPPAREGRSETRRTATPRRDAPPGERMPARERQARRPWARPGAPRPPPAGASPAPAKARGSPPRPDPATLAVRDGAGHPGRKGSGASRGARGAGSNKGVDLSPVRGMTLVEASKHSTRSCGCLIRTITQKWRPA